MSDPKQIIDCYNRTAPAYARKFLHELEGKHLDRILLKAFAEANAHRGPAVDLGCGPGQTTRFLAGAGLPDIVGVDLSSGMIAAAKEAHPLLRFKEGDILHLDFPDGVFGSAIAFYAIVHFTEEGVQAAFREVARVLKAGGEFLFSFHAGTETVHLDTFLEQPVHIDFYFFRTAKIITLVEEAGFDLIDALERQPYAGVEHPSTRAYIWAKKRG